MTDTATDAMFRPLRVGTMDLPNRIVMAPMTRTFSVDGSRVARVI